MRAQSARPLVSFAINQASMRLQEYRTLWPESLMGAGNVSSFRASRQSVVLLMLSRRHTAFADNISSSAPTGGSEGLILPDTARTPMRAFPKEDGRAVYRVAYIAIETAMPSLAQAGAIGTKLRSWATPTNAMAIKKLLRNSRPDCGPFPGAVDWSSIRNA